MEPGHDSITSPDDMMMTPLSLLHNLNSWTVDAGPGSPGRCQSLTIPSDCRAHFLPSPLCNYLHRPGVKHGNGGISHPNDDLPGSMSPSSLTR